MRLSRKTRQAVIDRATEAGYFDVEAHAGPGHYARQMKEAESAARSRLASLIGDHPAHLEAVTAAGTGLYRFWFKPHYQQGVA